MLEGAKKLLEINDEVRKVLKKVNKVVSFNKGSDNNIVVEI